MLSTIFIPLQLFQIHTNNFLCDVYHGNFKYFCSSAIYCLVLRTIQKSTSVQCDSKN